MGHQLGYAKENEANFIGFLACRGVRLIRRSGIRRYLDLYVYAIQELYFRDSVLAMSLRVQLNPGVRQDLRELRRFNRRYANPLEPMIWKAYMGISAGQPTAARDHHLFRGDGLADCIRKEVWMGRTVLASTASAKP